MLDPRLHALVPEPPPKPRKLTTGRVLFATVVLAVAGVVAYAYHVAAFVPPDQRIREGINQVEVGMTEQEVDEAMGRTADGGKRSIGTPECFTKYWRGNGMEGSVHFQDGKAISKNLWSIQSPEP